MSSIQKIKGRLGAQTLSRAHELFRQDLRTILSEALQNSRRANATRVDVETSEGRAGEPAFLTIRDDGCGIGDMQMLVTFGESSWTERTTATENAAGMGTYALASRGATYRSNGKRVTLTQAVFLGTEEAVVHDDPSPFAGLEVTFALAEGERATLEKTLEHEGRHYPLPVSLNGQRIAQSEFLAGCRHVESWSGIRIGLLTSADHARRLRGDSWRTTPNLNFHGHALKASDIEEIGNNEMTQRWTVLLDVVEAPDLKLLLPTRDSVIRNAFWQRLLTEAAKAKLRAIAKETYNTLPMSTYIKAKALGLHVPLPTIMLRGASTRANATELSYSEIDPAGSVRSSEIVLFDDSADETTTNIVIDALSSRTEGAIALMSANAGYEGHPAYDALRVASNPRLDLVTADDVTATLRLECDYQEQEDTREALGFENGGLVVERLELVMDVTGHTEATIRTPVAFAIVGPSENDPDTAEFVATKETSPHHIAQQLTELYYDDQDYPEDQFYDCALKRFSRYLQGGIDSAVCLLQNFLRSNRYELTAKGFKTIAIRETRRKGGFGTELKVTVTMDNGEKRSFEA